jgi:hypothetical protein
MSIVFCVVAVMTAGCSNRAQLFQDNNDGGWFSKPVDFFTKPGWAESTTHVSIDLGPSEPVTTEDLVNSDGTCAPKAVEASAVPTESTPATAPPTPEASRGENNNGPVNSTANPIPGNTGGSPAPGGIALGMSECETVRRAGAPGNVAISAGEQGERKVVLTYSGGSWPGVYTFNGGRLKVVDAVPQSERPTKPKQVLAKTKKSLQNSKSAAQQESTSVLVR